MAEAKTFPEVPVEKLRWRCAPESLPFENTQEIQACSEVIGQERALKAIRLGLEMESLGYNIFVVGLVGTGRNTTIKCLLEEIDKTGRIPDDLCYVNNFKDSDLPKSITLPAGKGKAFKKATKKEILSTIQLLSGFPEAQKLASDYLKMTFND